MTTPLTITATMGSPIVAVGQRPIMLDGPLAWAAAQTSGRWTHFGSTADDIDLPLARWNEGGTWGWCVSQARCDVVAETVAQVRRKPDLTAFARYTKDKRFHPALGPQKARDLTLPATWIRTLTWHADVTDPNRLRALLDVVTGIGKLAAHGYGHVLRWDVAPGPVDGWRDRPMPGDGVLRAYRPPYHAPERQQAC